MWKGGLLCAHIKCSRAACGPISLCVVLCGEIGTPNFSPVLQLVLMLSMFGFEIFSRVSSSVSQ